MKIYASAAYAYLVLFMTQIEHQSHARQIEIDSKDRTNTGEMKF